MADFLMLFSPILSCHRDTGAETDSGVVESTCRCNQTNVGAASCHRLDSQNVSNDFQTIKASSISY